MQITETRTEGLQREFKVIVPASDVAKSMDKELQRLQKKVRLDGFRPGKAPLNVLRQHYGQSVMADVLEELVQQSTQKAMQDRGLRMALRPKINLTSVPEMDKDVEYSFSVEVLPQIEPGEFTGISIEKPMAPVDEKRVTDALDRLLKSQRTLKSVDRPAKNGDVLIIDFKGNSNGKELPGMSSTDFDLELGAKMFVDTFEDQMVGVKTGDKRQVKVTFPKNYGNAELAGQPGTFDVTVKAVQEAELPALTDDLAKKFGAEGVDDLKAKIKARLQQDIDRAVRLRMKKQLLDKLAEKHKFPVPQGMVDLEFNGIWERLQDELKNGRAQEDQGKNEDVLKKEYRAIAERRVRLGLLLAEVGFREKIQVSQEELNKALFAEMQRFPGQERQVLEYFRSHPNAMDSLRGPAFEDKVIDHILTQVKMTEKTTTVEDLFSGADEDAE